MSQSATRIERDTFGPIDVPADRLWGAQTQRSLQYFRISTEKMPAALIRAEKSVPWVKAARLAIVLVQPCAERFRRWSVCRGGSLRRARCRLMRQTTAF